MLRDIPNHITHIGGRGNLYNEIYTTKDSVVSSIFSLELKAFQAGVQNHKNSVSNTQGEITKITKSYNKVIHRVEKLLKRSLLEFIPIQLCVAACDVVSNISDTNRMSVVQEFVSCNANISRYFYFLLTGIATTASELHKVDSLRDELMLDVHLFYELSEACKDGESGWLEYIKSDQLLIDIIPDDSLPRVIEIIASCDSECFTPISYIGLIIMAHIVRLVKFPDAMNNTLIALEKEWKDITSNLKLIFNYIDDLYLDILEVREYISENANVKLDEFACYFNYDKPTLANLIEKRDF